MAIRIIFKNVPLTGDKFRKIVAANADSLGLAINKAIFNYDENGSIKSTSPIRWGGNNKSVWLNAITDEAESLALTQTKIISQCLVPFTGHVTAIQLYEITNAVTLLPYSIDYTILNMVVDLPKSHQGKDDVELYLLEQLPTKIAQSFERQSAQLGLNIPDAMKSPDIVDYVTLEKITPVKIKPNANTYQMAVTFKVGIRAKIGSAWAVGRLLSRGHGQIIRSKTRA